jgi:hypothetical protein
MHVVRFKKGEGIRIDTLVPVIDAEQRWRFQGEFTILWADGVLKRDRRSV